MPSVVRAGSNSPEVLQAAAFAAWKHVAGETLSNQAVARNLEGQTLVVAVTDMIWQKQLESMAAQLLFRLNAALGQTVVTRLQFCIDPSMTTDGVPASRTAEMREVAQDEVSLELWSAANAIRDKRLRKIFLAAAQKNLTRENTK